MEDIDLELKILDYLQNHLLEADRREVELLRETSPAFAAKFNEVKQVWEGLDLRKVPDTSPELTSNFQAMLKTFELEQAHGKVSSLAGVLGKIADLFVYKPKYNWAYSILLISAGALGAWLLLKQSNTNQNLSLVENDQKQIRVLTMLKDSAANDRMKAVNYTQQLHHVDDKVINALFVTLNTDSNENVRLVTLDALLQLADNPKVREGLVNSIIKQESELMQVALADAMIQLQEKKSAKSFKKLLENQNTKSPIIKKKLEQTVKELETI